MKTKKLHLLMALFMAFTVTTTIAQVRGGCTSSKAYYNLSSGGGWPGDTDTASNSIDITVAPGLAKILVGVENPRQHQGQSWNFEVIKNGTSVSNDAAFAGNDYEILDPVPLDGDTASIILTMTPQIDVQGCTGATWTYTWNLTAVDCITPVMDLYFQINSDGGWNNGVTAMTIGTADTINFGISSIADGTWSWTTNSPDATISDTAVRNPDVSVFLAGTYTVTATFTKDCGPVVSQVFDVTVSAGCTAAANHAYSNIADGDGSSWIDHADGDITIDLIDVPSTGSVYLGVDPKVDMAWSAGCGQAIVAAGQEQVFTPTFDVNGMCTITASRVDNCGDTTVYTFNLTELVLGLEKFKQSGFSMYPNPAKDKLNITFNGDLDVTILNTAGQKVMSRSINGKETINVSRLSTGIYFVKLAAGNDVITQKFIKK